MDDRAPNRAVRAGSSALILLGTSVLFGWAIDVEALTSIVPGLATMKPATAMGFLASGISLGLLSTPGTTAARIQRALAIGVAVLGAVTLLEYWLSWDGGFDGLFLWEIDGDGPFPARMAEMTAISFLVAGVALLLASISDAWRWTQALAVLLFASGVTALVGYWYGVEALYAVGPFSSMALHTGAGFTVIAVSIPWSSPEHGLVAMARKRSVGGVTVRRYLLAAALAPLFVGWLQVLGVRTSFFAQEFGTAVVATASALLLSGVVLGYAWWVDHAERQRSELEHRLHKAQRIEALGRLAGGIAHDFNNVLTIILTTTSLMELDAEDESTLEDLATVRDACEKARALTKRLLALGRQQVLQPQVLSLNDLLDKDQALLRSLVPESIHLSVRATPDLGNVFVDPGLVEQVLLNLVVNAVDAMPGGGDLMIQTRNVDLDEAYAESHVEVEPGSYVVLVVSDSGVGMDAATRESIFEPFFTTKPPGKGSGLGLASVYGIVRQSGGHIWVYSELGEGTTFKIYLPRVSEAAEPIATTTKATDSPREGTAFVLVVDDDDKLGQLVAKILTRSGYLVHAAPSAAEALRFAEEHDGPIDLVLTDVTMPDMGGRELVQELVRTRPQLSFLYMSGYADDRVVRQGGADLLEKPFTPTELLARIETKLRA